MRFKKIYIAGKVTGLPYDEVKCKFENAKAELFKRHESIVIAVVDPLASVLPDETWPNAMRICISLLMRCDAIALLPDWNQSRGATLERQLALTLGMEVIHL